MISSLRTAFLSRSIMESVNLELLRTVLKTRVLSDISKQSGVHQATLMNWRDGKTQLPRKSSLERVLPLLGLKLEIIYS